MKKLTLIMCVFIVMSNKAYSHKEFTHQYIVREAYKLLKLQIGADIPILKNFISLIEDKNNDPCEDKSYNTDIRGDVIAGAWVEDVSDVIYDYGGSRGGWWWPSYTISSISHFWNADNGDNSDVWLFGSMKTEQGKSHNALNKAIAYYSFNQQFEIHVTVNNRRHYFSYNNLPDFYKNGNIYYKGYDIGGGRNVQNTYGNFEQKLGINQNDKTLRNKITFHLLGRLVHLLGDMGVPVHVHNEAHACTFVSGLFGSNNCDPYEQWMDVMGDEDEYAENEQNWIDPRYWSWKRVFMEKGESVKVDCNVEPIRYLMYTTNQVADFFASRGHDGNTNTEKIGELPYIYNTAHGPTTKNFYSDVLLEFPTKSDINDLRGIRDAAFTYSIRATAAMLLRFACESGILNEFTDTNLFHGVINYITEDQYPTNVYSDTVKLLGYFYEFQAKNKVVTGRNNAMSQKVFSIENTANVDMHASNTVNFKPGFHAVSGIRKIDNEKINDRSTYLHGYISPPNYCCNANVNTIERSTNLNKQSEEKIQTNPVLKIDLNEKPTLPNGVKYEEKSSSSEFTIAAYPNPLSKETRIEYKVPTKCKLKIIITNAKGEEIKKIVSESNHEKGIYEVDWNVEKEESGVYYCVLSSEGKQYVKTLILNK